MNDATIPQSTQIQALMRSDAYLKSWHPNHKETQNKVRKWYESRYNSNSVAKPWQDLGDVLLVGEGNFSFARGLLDNKNAHSINSLVATVFEADQMVNEDVPPNAEALSKHGAKVLYDIDATKIGEIF